MTDSTKKDENDNAETNNVEICCNEMLWGAAGAIVKHEQRLEKRIAEVLMHGRKRNEARRALRGMKFKRINKKKGEKSLKGKARDMLRGQKTKEWVDEKEEWKEKWQWVGMQVSRKVTTVEHLRRKTSRYIKKTMKRMEDRERKR
ncbi:uncharacterized protein MONOS_5274 [Monocercomonoides exilis]|uniref:uncharacterized protein n=1 Tax=Monocercomonoides exilis TaxID=2049356 RepID=UPI00355A9571|nr:hypothetical protein MONOS_5274 [Monocercomonoides exilis]|eukprot:MONOS_5274.1-p1 / transcript=MONOS_5274.1 / gene=MONOS_5274 / organism=Monocercomonoides_exilis_PA203 / gene_product=unspecified product / transcript_product=unspecified product / location=Mono_scaffold00151:98260-98694(-) / protein_length=145 / sequence_SO=supercontig / SO=protein_coding / is_pseudo=false